MSRTRTITVGGREVRLRERPLSIGGIPIIWMLESACYDDGRPVADEDLRAAGIRVPRRPASDDDDWSADDG